MIVQEHCKRFIGSRPSRRREVIAVLAAFTLNVALWWLFLGLTGIVVVVVATIDTTRPYPEVLILLYALGLHGGPMLVAIPMSYWVASRLSVRRAGYVAALLSVGIFVTTLSLWIETFLTET